MSGGHFARGASLSRGPMKKYWDSSELSMLGLTHGVRLTQPSQGPNAKRTQASGLCSFFVVSKFESKLSTST